VLAVAFLGAAKAPIVPPSPEQTPWTADSIAKLDADIDALLAGAPALRGAHVGVFAIDTSTGNMLYAHAADDEFQPASTMKLVVGSAALDELGGEFAFETDVTVAESGAAFGLAGGGDPTLKAADLADAARALVAASTLRSVASLSIDTSRYDSISYPNGWTWDDFGQDYAPIVSAVPLEEDLVHLDVAPAKAGHPALVSTADAATIAQDESRCAAAAPLTIVTSVTTGAPDSDDTLDVASAPGRCPTVFGSIPSGANAESIDISVDPVAYTRATFARALTAAGRRVSGSPAGSGSGRRVVWRHRSQTLAKLLGPRFWIPSDNLFGEVLLKEVGLAAAGLPGTTAKGVAFEKQWLQSIGVDPATTTIADGCGMSQYDRLTPRDLVAILQHDWNGPNRQLVLDSLPVGGARGTIEGIAGTPAAGRVFAKTGSMMHVRGLAGYLATENHGAVTFAFNVDDWNGEYPALAALRAEVLSRIITDGS
jgi:D-alanyl-D-alanine carboxypeptidase/D-alanyl-D-alanine-endopeptidase (penicillin-binding protein 4)